MRYDLVKNGLKIKEAIFRHTSEPFQAKEKRKRKYKASN